MQAQTARRVNLTDAVTDLCPQAPPCFRSQEDWRLYLVSAAGAQTCRGEPKIILTGQGGSPRINHDFDYCADCTAERSGKMKSIGRCDPMALKKQEAA